MRVAFFGGSFDPPHHGHMAIAAAAADEFDLERVLFAPVGRQPLKYERASATFADRVAMVELACRVDARFSVSGIDAPWPDGSPNYTVDTLAALREEMPDARLFNLVGADSFLDLRRWREPERLLELAEWIVVSRPGFALADLSPLDLSPEQRSRVHCCRRCMKILLRLICGRGWRQAIRVWMCLLRGFRPILRRSFFIGRVR